ncbi:type II toxin-antitoxin system PemK/MazF family toxin [Weissella koreensis]|uniref:type II toxin-antitoxin system PemK/MazF family toxin n=1 Tax=Weissella koreensis TaxID=165096 RepID=UPI0002175030|nr:type II toxin-antitoxin system PemK/MazF family toxin [Weissella koreensis]AEJ23350.1 PemK family regulatory protein [Weissella koreensis KACC 15510]MCZ9310860.1 type II toxin-antitoxin system PemK/MazF family toxin [Weissella koreensis]
MQDNKQKVKEIRRGEIWYANLENGRIGSEQGGVRPVLIVQNNVGNLYAPTTIVIPISTKKIKKTLPTHVKLDAELDGTGINRDSTLLLEQIRVIDKKRLQDRLGRLPEPKMVEVRSALSVSLGFD